MTNKKSLKAGQQKSISINWPATLKTAEQTGENIFLPLHGAEITLEDSEGKTAPISGSVYQGKFSFTVPRDGYRFKARLVGSYRHMKFDLYLKRSGIESILSVEFDDAIFTGDNYSLNLCDNSGVTSDPSNRIDADRAKAWSVFQGVVEVLSLASKHFNAEKKRDLRVIYNLEPKTSGGYYIANPSTMVINHDSVFSWDVIGQQIGFAIAYDKNITQGSPSGHYAFGISPYDNPKNLLTYKSKAMAVKEAFERAYGNWFAVYLLQFTSDPYLKTMSQYHNVGNTVYEDVNGVEVDFVNNNPTYFLGEDSEFSISRIFWELTAGNKPIAYPMQLFDQVLANKNLGDLGDFYRSLYQYHSGRPAGTLENSENTDVTDLLKKTQELAEIFTDQGITDFLDESQNGDLVNLFDTKKVALQWQQLKSNTGMPNHDYYELLFFSGENGRFELIDKIKTKSKLSRNLTRSASADSGLVHTLFLSEESRTSLINAIMPLWYKDKKANKPTDADVYVMIKAISNNIDSNSKETRIYYGTLNKVTVKAPSAYKKILLYVDDSGSNLWNDPSNKRVEQAERILSLYAKRNRDLYRGENNALNELPSAVGIISPQGLDEFLDPQDILDRNFISSSIKSFGTTSFTEIYYSLYNVLEMYTPLGEPNETHLYIISDFDNIAGAVLDKNQFETYVFLNWTYYDIEVLHLTARLALQKGAKVTSLSYGGNEAPNALMKPSKEDNYGADFFKEMYPRMIHNAPPYNMNEIVDSLLQTGGTCNEVKFDKAYGDWGNLAFGLSNQDWQNQPDIEFVSDINFLARVKPNGESHNYLYTAKNTGTFIVDVDSQGHFTPNLKVNGLGVMEYMGKNLYRLKFNAIEGEKYAITLNLAQNAQGLYGIVLYKDEINDRPNAISLAQGYLDETAAAIVNGDAVIWGNRSRGLHGNGNIDVAANVAATKVAGLKGIVALTGCQHNLTALDDKGDVYRWGFFPTSMGADNLTRAVPEKILSNIKQIVSGDLFTLALSKSGQAYIWGNNTYGQLANYRPALQRDFNAKTRLMTPDIGLGDIAFPNFQGGGGAVAGEAMVSRPNPERVNVDTPQLITLGDSLPIRLIGAGQRNVFAVTESGKVYNWGYLGISATSGREIITAIQQPVNTLSEFAGQIVSLGGGHGIGVALLDDGRVIRWNIQAELGAASEVNTVEKTPRLIVNNAKQVAYLAEGIIVLTRDGQIFSWGYGHTQQYHSLFNARLTIQSEIGQAITDIGSGAHHIIYQTNKGLLFGVGDNNAYKLDQTVAGGVTDWPGVQLNID